MIHWNLETWCWFGCDIVQVLIFSVLFIMRLYRKGLREGWIEEVDE